MDDIKEKKSGVKAYILGGLGVGVLLVVLYLNFSKPNYEIADIYTDSTAQGKYVFLFVETNSNDKNNLMNWANEIKNSMDLLAMPDKTQPAILTVYFYDKKNAAVVDASLAKSLQKRFPKKPDIVNKILFVPNGWQYIGHNDPSFTQMARDSIFKSMIIVPKPGYKAYDIIKN